MTISLCGSAALGLADSELKLEADFVALIPPYSNNFYNLTSFYNKKETEKIRMLRDEYKDIEKGLVKKIITIREISIYNNVFILIILSFNYCYVATCSSITLIV